MDQPPIDNPTDFVAHPQLILDKDGERLITIVKATFLREADGTLEVAPKKQQRKLRFADINADHRADYLMVAESSAVDAWLNLAGT